MVSHVCHFFPVRVCVLPVLVYFYFMDNGKEHNWQGRATIDATLSGNVRQISMGCVGEPLDVAISRCRDGFVIRGFGETHRA